ncbi:hypothetical protein KY284_012469 [Solanum tuberosum]|nr:hypothetical protein KY284_012469 [Solanum tuberosum]
MGTPKDKVKFNVGGRIFETTATTLAIAGENSLFRAMLDEKWNVHSNSAITEYFIDRDPDYFAVLLNLLRTGELYIPPKIDKYLLYREAEYYGILDHVRLAKWGPFDGNRAQLAQPITDWSAANGTLAYTIRASPSGWCCLAQGSVVRVYDWMLEEHPLIHIAHHQVRDICWVDDKHIVISSDKRLANGGMRLFNASTGISRCKFQVTDKSSGLAPFSTASTLDFGSDCKFFSSCENGDEHHWIGNWDLVTGKLINFHCSPPHLSLKKARRLQWLPGTNCLMAFYLDCAKVDIILFDFRDNTTVRLLTEKHDRPCDRTIQDAIVIEESSSICALRWNGALGFMDLRSTSRGVNWRNTEDPLASPYFPKLAYHEGQLFSSFNNRISVHSGSDWLRTSQLRHSDFGAIHDYSIGGNRLFSLQSTGNIINVWETPRPPII